MAQTIIATPGQDTLLFVYNADTGIWNGYMDIMHKVFSPKTYPCQLCAITHGTFKVKKSWDDFAKSLPVSIRFLHRDEWHAEFGRKDPLPAIFLKRGEEVLPWIDAATINIMDLESLKEYITAHCR